ncbi:MAG: ABC transporter ATP-binding protein [Lactobacillales bacterium]|jgi:ABC-2 type transport system ATP-binding protein|nr:ABC transporter ATP-binding protein [Lactobacillales bacterium]
MLLEFKHVTKKYGENIILDDISQKLTPGVYGLLGANGAGKTTLFKIICGIKKATSGRIDYDNRDISKEPEKFHEVLGYLPQDFSYYPEFTGLKFMLYMASLKGLKVKEAKVRCTELLKLVGLENETKKKIKNYSGGMKQRLGIAQAMINNPKVLILDEPTVGLDPKERVRFRNLISSLSDEKIIILSTHIVSDVEYIADEIIILRKGKIINRGVASELVEVIDDCVWEGVFESREVNSVTMHHIVSNQKHSEDGTVLRIISKESPVPNAKKVAPTLEDLYLYYFREENENND